MFFLQSWAIICLCVFVCVLGGVISESLRTENYPAAILSWINSYFHYSSPPSPLSILIFSIPDIPCLASSLPLNLENHTADVTELRYCSVIENVTIIWHLCLGVDNFVCFALFSPVICLADTSKRNIFCTFILAHIHVSQKDMRHMIFQRQQTLQFIIRKHRLLYFH